MTSSPILISLSELAPLVRETTLPAGLATRVIGIDGGSGAGKSTLAAILSQVMGSCPVIKTDDFSSWDEPFNWASRIQEQFLAPLLRGEAARYQIYDWRARSWDQFRDLPAKVPLIILEGVGALRQELRYFLSFSIFVECNADSRRRRSRERDSNFTADQWRWWHHEEDEYLRRNRPADYANLIVNGDSFVGDQIEVLHSRL